MLKDWTAISIYIVPLLLVWAAYGLSRRRRHTVALARLEASREAGLTEPASLHPVIDPALCLGCATCVDACPEGSILGLIGGKAQLVDPTACIGHGACREACPQDAISLVLGTETRGVEIPMVDSDFQTNVPGLYLAGELGGMGLIRNAIVQGTQAMDAIVESRPRGRGGMLDVLVVGAGPAGIAASLRARERGLRCVAIEQESFGGTVAHYPRGKVVMTAPFELPGYGSIRLREASKEQLLELWTNVVEQTGVDIRYGERLTALERVGDGFRATTPRNEYRSAKVLLAIGRRGTPRTLDVPGEHLHKVVYRLTAPEQYAGMRVLVVGGGDSALEAALSVSEEPGTDVTLSYRGEAFSRAKAKNRQRIEAAAASSQVQVLLGSQVTEISEQTVTLETASGTKELANDAVIVCAGGILPTPLLRAAGVEIEVHHGET